MRSKRFAAWDTDCLQINKLLKSGTIRLSAVFATLFLILTGVLMGTVLWIVNGTLTATLIRENDEDIETVANGYRDEGIDEAAEVVRQRLGNQKYSRAIHPDNYMVLENAQGAVLAGNLPPQPQRLGVFYTPLSPSPGGYRGQAAHAMLLGRGTEIAPGAYLFVGRDIRPMLATRARIIDAFILVTIIAAAIAVAAGLYVGRRFAQRVDAVARACERIIEGHMDQRIELPPGHSEWDRLAGVINNMLDRIAALLENLRQVSSDIAHDLRTPLTRLRNRLERAREESASTADYLGAINGAIEDTDQTLSMFTAVLRISQVEAGSRLAKFANVDLSEVCEKVFRIYLPVAEDYGHRLTASLAGGVSVRGDSELLTQMFTNLIENAIHHTQQGATIELALASDAGAALASVRDDGPGIPREQTEKVLQRFYRLAGSRATPGHGLGLALVAAIVQLHGAKIALEDAAPGLRVAIRFPA